MVLLKEFKDVKNAPPPINLVMNPLMALTRYMLSMPEKRTGFSSFTGNTLSKELVDIEQSALRAYVKHSKTQEGQTVESRVKRVDEGISRVEDEMLRAFDWLTTRVDSMQGNQDSQGSINPDTIVKELRRCTDENVKLREEMVEMKKALQKVTGVSV